MCTYDPDGARRRCRAAHGSAGGRRAGVHEQSTQGYSKGTQTRVLKQGHSNGTQKWVLKQAYSSKGYSRGHAACVGVCAVPPRVLGGYSRVLMRVLACAAAEHMRVGFLAVQAAVRG